MRANKSFFLFLLKQLLEVFIVEDSSLMDSSSTDVETASSFSAVFIWKNDLRIALFLEVFIVKKDLSSV